MLFLGAPYPCISSLLPPTVLTLLFYVLFLIFLSHFRSISVTFGKKYYPFFYHVLVLFILELYFHKDAFIADMFTS